MPQDRSLDFHVNASHNHQWGEYSLQVHARHSGGGVSVATEMVMEKIEYGQVAPPPLMTLKKEAAQELFDSLWNSGLRPSRVVDEFGAKDRHITDLRKIAFKVLKIEG